MKKNVVIFGAGISGCTIARLFAENGHKVTIYERRNHVGGNVYDKFNEFGIREQLYGPHIFHTNDDEVFKFLSRFTEWIPYTHKVKGNIFGQLTTIPFNFESIDLHFPQDVAKYMKQKLIEKYGKNSSVTISELSNCKDFYLSTLAEFVFKNVFRTYSKKQWGKHFSNLDSSVTSRVPIYVGYNDTYFKDRIQCQPLNGFSLMIENMLAHPNITIHLNSTLNVDVNKIDDSNIYVYCGSIDELFNFKFGKLEYRSLKFKFKTLKKESYQKTAVINFNTSKRYTRITEFKKLTLQDTPYTTICLEYPCSIKHGKEKYYPISSEKNLSLYKQYKKEKEKLTNVYMLGRLGTYKYLNMDAAVRQAIDLYEEIKHDT